MSTESETTRFHFSTLVDRVSAPRQQWGALSDSTRDNTDDLGFDQVVERLRTVVARLEQGNLSLEESLAAYESGVNLARRGHSLLDNVEKRVEMLVRDAGGDAVVPLDSAD